MYFKSLEADCFLTIQLYSFVGLAIIKRIGRNYIIKHYLWFRDSFKIVIINIIIIIKVITKFTVDDR